MDEANSHLDVDLEKAVNSAVAALSITRIIVAHRSQTIAGAGRVVALAGGAIVADVGQQEVVPVAR
jgi:ATP-binding cassette subfamily B protein RaxB